MPPPAAPFEAPPALISLLSVSISGGLTFSAPVTVPSSIVETAIVDTATGGSPVPIPATDVTVVATDPWTVGLPSVGDPWTFNPPPAVLQAVAPATGFAAGSGLVVA
jgi:hypothetical protein